MFILLSNIILKKNNFYLLFEEKKLTYLLSKALI